MTVNQFLPAAERSPAAHLSAAAVAGSFIQGARAARGHMLLLGRFSPGLKAADKPKGNFVDRFKLARGVGATAPCALLDKWLDKGIAGVRGRDLVSTELIFHFHKTEDPTAQIPVPSAAPSAIGVAAGSAIRLSQVECAAVQGARRCRNQTISLPKGTIQ